MLNLLKHETLSRWGAVLGWSIGLGAFGALYISIYPQVAEEMAGLADIAIYAAMGMDVGSFEGFIGSSVVQFVPIILGIYAIITSTGILAGEEDDGTLEMIVTMPLARWQIVTVKALALGIILFLISVLAAGLNVMVLEAVKQTAEVDVSASELFLAMLNGWPVTFAFAMIGLCFSAFFPTRRVASLTLTVIFIASYFMENLGEMVEDLDVLAPFSLFTYFDSSADVFREGVQAGDVAVLLVVSLVFFGLAVLSFSRRNITVGAWPWQRPQPEA